MDSSGSLPSFSNKEYLKAVLASSTAASLFNSNALQIDSISPLFSGPSPVSIFLKVASLKPAFLATTSCFMPASRLTRKNIAPKKGLSGSADRATGFLVCLRGAIDAHGRNPWSERQFAKEATFRTFGQERADAFRFLFGSPAQRP